MDQAVVVVGAGLAGLRAAEGISATGVSVQVIGDEPYAPYNRPPLSKAIDADIEALAFRRKRDDIEWALGTRVLGVDIDAQVLSTDAGERRFDALVIASGLRARHLDVPGPRPISLRTLDDARVISAQIAPGTTVVIVGAGFVGCELAATLATHGCDVVITAYDAVPMVAAIGEQFGTAMRQHLENLGVRFVLGVGVQAYGERSVSLADGQDLDADVVIEAVGAVPNVEWLHGSGVDCVDGVLCDEALRVGTGVPIVAAGDIARYPNRRFDDIPRRIEHWSNANDTGRRAAITMRALLEGREPELDFAPLPSFWSDQGTISLHAFGLPFLGEAALVDGSWDGACIVEYRRAGRLVGVAGVNRTADLLSYREAIGEA